MITRDYPSENEVSAPDYLIELYNKFNRGVGEVEEEEENANKIFTFYRSGTVEVKEERRRRRGRRGGGEEGEEGEEGEKGEEGEEG